MPDVKLHGDVLIVEGKPVRVSDDLQVSGHLSAKTATAQTVVTGKVRLRDITSGTVGDSVRALIAHFDLRSPLLKKLKSGARHALSHLDGDILALNNGKGYVNGIELHGSVHAPDSLTVGVSVRHGPLVNTYARISAEGIFWHDVSVLKFPDPFTGGTSQTLGEETINLVAEIKKLRADVQALKAALNP